MEVLTELYNLIQAEDIILSDHHIENHKAVAMNIEDNYAIFVDYSKIKTLADEICTIAHEWGHCNTGALHRLYSRFDLIEKHEWKANKKAVERIIPYDELEYVVSHGYVEIWELAEHFDVTEEFMKISIEIYKATRGI